VNHITRQAQQFLEDLLTFFGVNTQVEASEEDDTIQLLVNSDSGGKLIGHRGENLAAMQYLVNMMIRQLTTERIYVHIDVGGYKKARTERIVGRALEIARDVEETGQPQVLPPMNAGERRQVHMALAELPGVETESQGEGRGRRITIRKRES
jgi:spoIIIJ-associated protein